MITAITSETARGYGNMSEQKQTAPTPYAWEELLSFDRLKRAVLNRVMEHAEQAEREGLFLSTDKLSDIAEEEWQRAKEALRSSPQARQAAREHLHQAASDMVDNLIRNDRKELEDMGVVEKTL